MENTPTQSGQKMTPKFFFVSLGVLVSLIATVTSFLNLVFETLTKHFPDALNATYTYGYSTYSYESMRTALATLIIVFPVFLLLSKFWTKIVKEGLGNTDAIIKKWMLYLVLFLASIVIITDLVTLVRYFVSGEITVRFILKVLVVFVTAGISGFHYYSELVENAFYKGHRTMMATVATILVLFAITMSFVVMGSPFKQRSLRLDERRVQDLQTIQYQIINFWQMKEKLPTDLKELSSPISGTSLPVDPEFEKGITYEYKSTGKLSFELCGTFALPMPKGWQEYGGGRDIMPMPAVMNGDVAVSSYPYPGGGVNDSWDHQSGRTCFTRTIDKDIYPAYPKPLKQ
jgi:Domain of unknown function (DUF5671)